VGDRHHRAGVLGQVALEPGHRLGVQVVGGLVEQQQVGLAQQKSAQRHAAALPTGQRGHLGVAGRHTQRVHRGVQRGLQAPGVGGVNLLLQARELVGSLLGVVGRQLVEAIQQRALAGHPVLHVAAHVLGRVQRRLLLQQPDAGAGRQLGMPAELLVAAGHDRQQARLARAVEAQHADLRARQERQRYVLEHLLVGRVDPRQAVHGEDVLARHGRRG
jgi:hypothetical protein